MTSASTVRARDDYGLEPRTTAELLLAALARLESILPPGWAATTAADRRSDASDAALNLTLDNRVVLSYQVQSKRTLARRRDVTGLIARSDTLNRQDDTRPLLLARYIAPPLQSELREHNIAYADATGNVFLSSSDPLILVADRGADADPWRGPGRPTTSLKGMPAALLVRALADYEPPYTVPQLAALADASLGATYRLIEFLADEGLLDRTERGPINKVDWRNLLQRWSQEYRFQESNTTTSYLEPRGIDELLSKLRQGLSNQRYALTGSLAAQPYATYAEPRLALIFADSPSQLAADLGLRPASTGANVIIATPRSPVVYARTSEWQQTTIVAPSQAAVDLLTGPGRNPAEGEHLLDWMERNADGWRRKSDR